MLNLICEITRENLWVFLLDENINLIYGGIFKKGGCHTC